MKIKKFNESIVDNISLITFNEIDTLQKIISESKIKLDKYYNNINDILLDFFIIHPELLDGDELDKEESKVDTISLSNDNDFYLDVNYWYDFPHYEEELKRVKLTEEQVKQFIIFYNNYDEYLSSKKYNI